MNIQFHPNGENRTGEIVQAILDAPPGSTIRFSKGRYDFYREGAFSWYLTPPCNANSDKQVIFPLIGKKIESMVLESITATFKKNAKYCQDYLRENGIS